MRWLRRTKKQFKGIRPRRKPSAPKMPKPQYKSPPVTKKLPKIKKPVVDVPFIDSDSCLHTEAVSGHDFSDQAFEALEGMVSSGKASVTGIQWENNTNSNDDDGWCAQLAGMSWDSLDDLLAAAGSKPEYYKRKDERRMGKFNPRSIMGIAHAGCDCHVVVTLDGGRVYHVTTDNPAPIPAGGASASENVEDELGRFGEVFW